MSRVGPGGVFIYGGGKMRLPGRCSSLDSDPGRVGRDLICSHCVLKIIRRGEDTRRPTATGVHCIKGVHQAVPPYTVARLQVH